MNEISRVFAPLLFKFLRLPKFPQFKFSEFKHDAHMSQPRALPEARDVTANLMQADLSRLEWDPSKNMGKNGEKSQGETLKNKSNHTSTRQSNTQDPQGYMNNKRKDTRQSSSPRGGLDGTLDGSSHEGVLTISRRIFSHGGLELHGSGLSLKRRRQEQSSPKNELSYLLTLERRWRWSIYSLSHEGVSGRGIQGQRLGCAQAVSDVRWLPDVQSLMGVRSSERLDF